MSSLSESDALAILERELARVTPGVTVGMGDDCAVLRTPAPAAVWTIDACAEGVHFERAWLSVEDVAHKALHAAVSDLAAMGAKPVGCLVQMTLAPWLGKAELRRLARAEAAVGQALGCPVVGGNLTAGQGLELVTTALGTLPQVRTALLRTGAQPGDEVWLVGAVGHARLGLLVLQQGLSRRASFGPYVAAFRRPRARVREGRLLRGRAHACLDVSDGLLRDAPRLAGASGVRVVLEEARLVRHIDAPFRRAALALGVEPLEALLTGGEDYALLATGPAQRTPRGARRVGRVEEGSGAWLETPRGLRRLTGGFEHRS